MADKISRREFLKGGAAVVAGTVAAGSGLLALTELLGVEPNLLSSVYTLVGIGKDGLPNKNLPVLGWVKEVLATNSLISLVSEGKEARFKNPKGIDSLSIVISPGTYLDPINVFLATVPGGLDPNSYFWEFDGLGNQTAEGSKELTKDIPKILINHPGTHDLTFEVNWHEVLGRGDEIAQIFPENIRSSENWPENVRVTKTMNAVIHSPDTATPRNTSVIINIYNESPDSRLPIAYLEWSLSGNEENARVVNMMHGEVSIKDSGFLSTAQGLSSWFDRKVQALQ